MHFCPGTMTTHAAESINSDLQRGLDRRLRHTQHWTQNRKEMTGDSICCIACNKWYHTKCAKLNKKKLNYKENRTLSGTAWCCMNEICPFHQVEFKKFLNLVTQTNQIITNDNKNCGICEKTVKQSVNSVHRKNHFLVCCVCKGEIIYTTFYTIPI